MNYKNIILIGILAFSVSNLLHGAAAPAEQGQFNQKATDELWQSVRACGISHEKAESAKIIAQIDEALRKGADIESIGAIDTIPVLVGYQSWDMRPRSFDESRVKASVLGAAIAQGNHAVAQALVKCGACPYVYQDSIWRTKTVLEWIIMDSAPKEQNYLSVHQYTEDAIKTAKLILAKHPGIAQASLFRLLDGSHCPPDEERLKMIKILIENGRASLSRKSPSFIIQGREFGRQSGYNYLEILRPSFKKRVLAIVDGRLVTAKDARRIRELDARARQQPIIRLPIILGYEPGTSATIAHITRTLNSSNENSPQPTAAPLIPAAQPTHPTMTPLIIDHEEARPKSSNISPRLPRPSSPRARVIDPSKPTRRNSIGHSSDPHTSPKGVTAHPRSPKARPSDQPSAQEIKKAQLRRNILIGVGVTAAAVGIYFGARALLNKKKS